MPKNYKSIKLIPFVVGHPLGMTPEQAVETATQDLLVNVWRKFLQVSVEVDSSSTRNIHYVEWPADLSGNSVPQPFQANIDMGEYMIWGLIVPPDVKTILNHLETRIAAERSKPGWEKAIPVIYVPGIGGEQNQQGANGFALARFALPRPSDAPYLNTVFISIPRLLDKGRFKEHSRTTAHEIGHLLTNDGHVNADYFGEDPAKGLNLQHNLMYADGYFDVLTNGSTLDSKRLYGRELILIHDSTLLSEPKSSAP